MLQWMYMDNVQRSVCVMMILLVLLKVLLLLSQSLPLLLVRIFLPTAYLVDTKIDIKRFVTSILSVHNRAKTLSNYDLLLVTFITICCKILEGKLW